MNSNILPNHSTGNADRNRLKLMLAMLVGVAMLGTLASEVTIGLSVALLSAIVSIRLWKSIGSDIAMADLAAFIATLQWIICPYVAFQLPLYQSSEYAMSGSLESYFTFAVPGTAMFFLGINLVRLWYSRDLPQSISIGPPQITVAYILVGIAIIADFVSSYSPNSIQFALKVLTDLKFGAIVIFLYSRHRLRWPVIGILAAIILFRSRNVGMFHETLIWAAIFNMYAFYRFADPRKPVAVFLSKVVVAVVGTATVICLQLVKTEFRTSLAQGENISLLKMSIERALDFRQVTSEESLAHVLVRFNQGWIISRILEHIPSHEPFQNGGSFVTAAETVAMPRVLFPNRAPVEISRRFYQFTGVRINDTTCMGISFLGEAYGNFGLWGGILTMVILGMILSASIEYTRSLIRRYPLIFFLIGVIFSEPIKAETDSTNVLNYIFKSAILVIALVYVFRHSFSPNAFPTTNQLSRRPARLRPTSTSS